MARPQCDTPPCWKCNEKIIFYFQITWTYFVCYHKAYGRFDKPCKSPKENNEILLQTSNANKPCKHTHTSSYSCSWICNLEKLGTRVGPIHHWLLISWFSQMPISSCCNADFSWHAHVNFQVRFYFVNFESAPKHFAQNFRVKSRVLLGRELEWLKIKGPHTKPFAYIWLCAFKFKVFNS